MSPTPARRPGSSLPDALNAAEGLALARRPGLVGLDYDGVLTPIVARAEDAVISEAMRTRVRALARLVPVAVISGRPVAEVARMVAIDGLDYAGSHGSERITPDGEQTLHPGLADTAHLLDAAHADLDSLIGGIEGVILESKASAITVHDRAVAAEELADISAAARRVAGQLGLELTGGKSIHELRLPLDCDKGTILTELLASKSAAGSPPDAEQSTSPSTPTPAGLDAWFIGDDETDEDAFAAIGDRGVAIAVGLERATSATYVVPDVEAVGLLLDILIATWSRPTPG